MRRWNTTELQMRHCEKRTYLHLQVREETAKLSQVRQLLYDYLRAGKAWKAPRTEEVAETNPSNVVPMDVGSLHRKGGKGKKGKGKVKNKGDRPRHDGKGKGEQSVKQRYLDGYCNQCGEYGHKKPDCAGKNKIFRTESPACDPLLGPLHFHLLACGFSVHQPLGLEHTRCTTAAWGDV